MNFKGLLPIVILLFCLESTSQSNLLNKAMQDDDVEWFERNCNKDDYQSVFYSAVEMEALKIVAFLLKNGVAINEYDSTGSTVLIKSVMTENVGLVQLLLDNNADPNLGEEKGLEGTPLMYATSRKNPKLVRMLIEYGAEVNRLDVNKDPALNWATYYGNTRAMKILMEHGADLYLKSKHGMPVDVAFRLWHADSVAGVFREAGFGKELTKSELQFMDAVKTRNFDKLNKLLKKGVSPNTHDQLGSPMIHLAAESGDTRSMELLINAGADPNQLNRVGQSALTIASRFGHSKTVDFLLAKGADPSLAGEEYNLTPLIGLAVNGSVAIGKALIDAGAKLDERDIVNSATALHWSMFYGNKDIAKLLLDEGADYKQKLLDGQHDGRSLALAYGYDKLVKKMDQLGNILLGEWEIEEINYIYADTTYRVEMKYPGRLMVTPNTYAIMYNGYGSQRKSAESLNKLSDEEKIYSFHTIVFNSGNYELTDSTFTTTADMAKVAGFEGGIQTYRIEKESGEINLVMYDETYPSGKKPDWYQKLEIKFVLTKK